MTALRWRVLALVVLAALAVAAVLLSREDRPDSAVDFAADSCGHVERFNELVVDNARVDEVLQALGEAEQSARAAAREDGTTWTGLLGAVQSLRIALDADDPRFARQGLDVIRAECRKVGR